MERMRDEDQLQPNRDQPLARETRQGDYPTDDPDLLQLADLDPEGTAYIDSSAVERLEGITTTDIEQGDTDINQERVDGNAESFDLLTERELRAGETDDVMEAIQEGYTYVPPIDPPLSINPSNLDTAQIATGTDLSTADLDFPESEAPVDHLSDTDMVALVRQALRADSSTQHLSERLQIIVVDSTAILRGKVDDLDDTDSLVEVVSAVPGIAEVRDETGIVGMD